MLSELDKYYHLNEFEQYSSFWSLLNSSSSSQAFTFLSITLNTSVSQTLIKMSYQQIDSIFSFCNIFSNINHVFTVHWLKWLKHKFSKYKINEVINLVIYLNLLNMLFMNNIIKWAESHSDTIRLLSIKNLTTQNLTSFKFLLCKRFSFRIIKIFFISFNIKLFKL